MSKSLLRNTKFIFPLILFLAPSSAWAQELNSDLDLAVPEDTGPNQAQYIGEGGISVYGAYYGESYTFSSDENVISWTYFDSSSGQSCSFTDNGQTLSVTAIGVEGGSDCTVTATTASGEKTVVFPIFRRPVNVFNNDFSWKTKIYDGNGDFTIAGDFTAQPFVGFSEAVLAGDDVSVVYNGTTTITLDAAEQDVGLGNDTDPPNVGAYRLLYEDAWTVSGVDVDNGNYGVGLPRYVDVTITKAPLTVFCPDIQVEYQSSAALPDPVFSGLVSGETSANLVDTYICSTAYAAGDPPGNYDLSVNSGTERNYTVATQTGVLTVVDSTRVSANSAISPSNLSLKEGASAEVVLSADQSGTWSVTSAPADATVSVSGSTATITIGAGAQPGSGTVTFLFTPDDTTTYALQSHDLDLEIIQVQNVDGFFGGGTRKFC